VSVYQDNTDAIPISGGCQSTKTTPAQIRLAAGVNLPRQHRRNSNQRRVLCREANTGAIPISAGCLHRVSSYGFGYSVAKPWFSNQSVNMFFAFLALNKPENQGKKLIP